MGMCLPPNPTRTTTILIQREAEMAIKSWPSITTAEAQGIYL